ncbi:hypothetical protein [Rhizobium sp. Root482]|uniref:hypothetical protein n=1 Tax=Rhizobium sp. Root482 TaxID=1736543 RepID=UPI0006FCFA50|nr:hypothetical protein [Rhizobium sp. Root482]KQY26213.1 hypothetical protein ASD31_19610 [Rhizobium sp. Root482]
MTRPQSWFIATRPGRLKIETWGQTDDDVIYCLSDNDHCFYSLQKFSYTDIDWHEDRYNCRINTDASDHNQVVEFDIYELPSNVYPSTMEWMQNWLLKHQPTPEPVRTLRLCKIESR